MLTADASMPEKNMKKVGLRRRAWTLVASLRDEFAFNDETLAAIFFPLFSPRTHNMHLPHTRSRVCDSLTHRCRPHVWSRKVPYIPVSYNTYYLNPILGDLREGLKARYWRTGETLKPVSRRRLVERPPHQVQRSADSTRRHISSCRYHGSRDQIYGDFLKFYTVYKLPQSPKQA